MTFGVNRPARSGRSGAPGPAEGGEPASWLRSVCAYVRRPGRASSTRSGLAPKLVLLGELDRLSETSHVAKAIAADVRTDARTVDRWVAWAAWHAAESAGAWVSFDPVVRALAQYEIAANGVDLARAPSLDERRRQAVDEAFARLAGARALRAEAGRQAQARQQVTHLQTIRAEQRGTIR